MPFLLINLSQLNFTLGAMAAIRDEVADINTRAHSDNIAHDAWVVTGATMYGFHIEQNGRTFIYQWPTTVSFDPKTGVASLKLESVETPDWPRTIRDLILAPEHERERRMFLRLDTDQQYMILLGLGVTKPELNRDFQRYIKAIEAVTTMPDVEKRAA